MMKQYMDIKRQNPDCLLFYRLGDFYEMFFEDAITASRELDLTLTGRDCGMDKRAEMCGVPFHAVETYLSRLLAKGFKVAVCEQLTDPSAGKGIVDRGVVRIFTPGTVVEDQMLESGRNHYLVGLDYRYNAVGLAVVDVSTGEFRIGEIAGERWAGLLRDRLCRLQPAEIIAHTNIYEKRNLWQPPPERLDVPVYECALGFDYADASIRLEFHFHIRSIAQSQFSSLHAGVCAAGGVLLYLVETQKNALTHINELSLYKQDGQMMLDEATRRNLELVETMRSREKRGSLLWLLDKTVTPMGGRMLRRWLEQPLGDKEAIDHRLEAVTQLHSDVMWRDEMRELLRNVHDLERMPSRIEYPTFNGRDALLLCESISNLPLLMDALSQKAQALCLQDIAQQMDDLQDLRRLLHDAISPTTPANTRDGGIFKEGYNAQLDQLRALAGGGKDWLAHYEQQEREATGIKSLRVRYNRVFGYYIDVTNTNQHLVPDRYVRRQTLANSERYTTMELKEAEDRILSAEADSIDLENQLFQDIRQQCRQEVPRIQRTARLLAQLDALLSLAVVAAERKYTCPQMHTGDKMYIVEGRHPVVEAMIDRPFVPNDIYMDDAENRCMIMTGPNMAGKSTYLRQVALIALMAHCGSFVPAQTAEIPILDRIFTRVGASDDLSSGQSTFMVEMNEVAAILSAATRKSLLILDEVGRGTSTYDGLSIAWAVVEHVSDPETLGAKTLFATHYHELTELEMHMPGVLNFHVAVHEEGRDVIFMHKIVRGCTDRSFGIHVARMAGLPEDILERAEEILKKLEATDLDNPQTWEWRLSQRQPQIQYVKLIDKLRQLDMTQLSPIQAINSLYELQLMLADEEKT